MPKRERISNEIIDAAKKSLERLIATPPLAQEKILSKQQAFNELKAQVKEAIKKGHSIETIVADLKGAGFDLKIATARQYLKPGKSRKTKQAATTPGKKGE